MAYGWSERKMDTCLRNVFLKSFPGSLVQIILIPEGIAYLTSTSDRVPLFPHQGRDGVIGPPDGSRGGRWGGQRSLGDAFLFPEFLKAY